MALVVNSGTSSKRTHQYMYNVPKAHLGTFEIAPKEKNVLTKVGVSGFYEEILRIKQQMVNYRDAILCRNSFSVCVAQKFGWNRNSFHMNPITKSNMKLFFPSFLSTKTPLCKIYCFTRKIQARYAEHSVQNICCRYSKQPSQ